MLNILSGDGVCGTFMWEPTGGLRTILDTMPTGKKERVVHDAQNAITSFLMFLDAVITNRPQQVALAANLMDEWVARLTREIQSS